ncbi:helix-turn-helix transcriptional regulator [Prolixibacteraceae bacterium]|nr:helix-turn-helix transcriptional regulator [Prolixibacteraceae bacterium]
MDTNELLSRNIKNLREKFTYTQAFVADYLDITAAAVNQYENDARSIPENVIEKLALLYNVDEFDLYEEDPEKQSLLASFAFRAEEITAEDMNTISQFKKIITNYVNMSSALNNG